MKKIFLAAILSAFVTAPLVACGMDDHGKSDDKASLSTEKSDLKAETKSKKHSEKYSKKQSKKHEKLEASKKTDKADI